MLEITSIIENFSSSSQLSAEHGLSLHIKHGSQNYLVDTGASDKFINNAQKMGIDLRKLEAVIISHNHYDHTGGLPALLEMNKEVKVYIKNAAKSEFFYKTPLFKKHLGGEKLLNKYADRFVFFDDEHQISNSIQLLSNEVHDPAYECKDLKLLEKVNGRYVADSFNHELFMVIEENGRLLIISSCSHNGIVNIVNTVGQKYSGQPISHIVGGFHLAETGLIKNSSRLNCTEAYVQEIAKILKDTGAEIHTGHCTGKRAYNLMKEELGDSISYFEAGQKISIP